MRTAHLRASARALSGVARHRLAVVREDPAVAFVRSRGPLRRVLAALCEHFVATRGWEPLGFARAGDWARERVGLSARQVQDLARTSARLARLPVTESALVSGAHPWSKVRLIARIATAADEAAWVERARRIAVRQLEHEVRAIDRGAIEVMTDEEGAPKDARAGIRIRCTGAVQAKWSRARWFARRVAGEALPPWEAMEAVAAEVLSAFPLEADPGMVGGRTLRSEPERAATVCAAQGGMDSARLEASVCTAEGAASHPPAVLPRFLAHLVEGLEDADAFALDARLREAVALEQRLEADLGAHLLEFADEGGNLERHAREHLGISPRKARGILRLARAARAFPALTEAWRTGRISWAKAQTVLSALVAEPGRAAEWIALAERATLRRLEDDVDRQLCARDYVGAETWVFWVGPADSIRLFRATLCTVRRRIERETGHLPTEGEGLEAMLDHALRAWGWRESEQRVPRTRRVFERDGWRCTVPGCTSYRNLHAHHVRFRSAGGSDDEPNLVSLCAWHHLRGVHAGRVRITGQAPDGLRFELGVRPGFPPLMALDAKERLTYPLRP